MIIAVLGKSGNFKRRYVVNIKRSNSRRRNKIREQIEKGTLSKYSL